MTETPKDPVSGPAVRTTPTGLVRPATKAATFRLPLDVHEAINEAIADEANRGNRLTKDAAVTDAVRAWAEARARET